MMGMGIVEPADQFDLARLDAGKLPAGWTIQPSHPELLEALTNDFISSGFNIRYIIAGIADSSAYQLSARFNGEWKAEYTTYFARKFTRRLMGEEINDAITVATSIPVTFSVNGYDPPLLVQWAMQLPEPFTNRGNNGGLFNIFLIGDRDQSPRSNEATILQALNMMNNTFITTRVRNARVNNVETTVFKLLADRNLTDARVVEELFLGTLSRFPTASELAMGVAALRQNRVTGAENLHLSLLNKIDFLFNY